MQDRDEVIDYVAKKYGRDKVSQIITFEQWRLDKLSGMGRALGYNYTYCDRLAKMIPFSATLEQTINQVSDLEKCIKQTPKPKE